MAKPKRRRVNHPATVKRLVEKYIPLAMFWAKLIKGESERIAKVSLAEFQAEALAALFMAARTWPRNSPGRPDFKTYAKIAIRREVCRLARAARFPTRKSARYFDPEAAASDPEVLSLDCLGHDARERLGRHNCEPFSDRVQSAIRQLQPLEWIAFKNMTGLYGHRQPIRQTAGIMGLTILEVDALYNRAVEKMKRALA